VAPILGQPEDVTVGEPRQLGGKLVALARGGANGHGEPVLERARNMTFEPAQMVHIGDDALAGLASHGRNQRHAAWRHVDDLARKFAPVGQHVAAKQIDPHALEPTSLVAQRPHTRNSFSQRHAELPAPIWRKPRRAVLTGR
jgi:hypothetical protein